LNGVRRLYEVLVRNPVPNAVVLGLLGVWASYSGLSSYLKQSEPWPGVVTLGVMAIICAAQGLTGSSRIELMCSWRILLTFFGLYMIMKLMAGVQGGVGFAVVKCIVVIGMVYFYAKIWRRSYADSWGLNKDEGHEEYSAPNPGPQPDGTAGAAPRG
jgi:hypothetical protein